MANIHQNTWLHESAVVLGEVTLAEEVNVWCNAVLRAVGMRITIGRRSNVQDCVVMHGDIGNDITVGACVSLGHGAIIHGCTIEDNCIIGMNAVVLDGAHIGAGSIVGAGAVVPSGMVVPPRSLVLGMPAKVKKELGESVVQESIQSADEYWAFAQAAAGEAP